MHGVTRCRKLRAPALGQPVVATLASVDDFLMVVDDEAIANQCIDHSVERSDRRRDLTGRQRLDIAQQAIPVLWARRECRQ